MKREYEVLTQMLGGEWENVWSDNGKPLTFDSVEEAKAELEDFTQNSPDEHDHPDMYKIVEVIDRGAI